MSEEIASLTGGSFDAAVLSSGIAYLVDFWADWCAPCTAYEPVLAEVAEEYAGRLRMGRVDIVAWPELAERCGVKSVPAVVLFQGGEISKRIFGAREKQQLSNELSRFLPAS